MNTVTRTVQRTQQPHPEFLRRRRREVQAREAELVHITSELIARIAGRNRKRLAWAPGVNESALSRAANGDPCNPLYRLGALIDAGGAVGDDPVPYIEAAIWLLGRIERSFGAYIPPLDEALLLEEVADIEEAHANLPVLMGDRSREALRALRSALLTQEVRSRTGRLAITRELECR
jgi:hypothetical protein